MLETEYITFSYRTSLNLYFRYQIPYRYLLLPTSYYPYDYL